MNVFYAPCPKGLEAALRAEVLACGGQLLADMTAGVRFQGTDETAMRMNLESRIASRIMQQVAHANYSKEDDIYALGRSVAWEKWHSETASLRVDVTANQSPLKSLHFAGLRIKDAICDHHRELSGERPSVDTQRPARRIFAFLNQQEMTLYLDWSGESLFKRGWRLDKGEAPIKENLAAGLLALAGYSRDTELIQNLLADPFCGSGTIAIEAAQIALDLAPGLQRPFACERFRQFDRGLWNRLREQLQERHRAKARLLQGHMLVHGSDVSIASIVAAEQNALRAGIPAGSIKFKQLDALNLKRLAEKGLILTNPPYGERIDQGGAGKARGFEEFWPLFGKVLKTEFTGWSACILSPDTGLPRGVRMDTSKRTPVFNGAIECRLFRFELYAGSKRVKQA
jgi:putative N6-adenine-specific DNA methylase